MIGIYPNVMMNRIPQRNLSFKSEQPAQRNDVYDEMLKLEEELNKKNSAKDGIYDLMFDKLRNSGLFCKKERAELADTLQAAFKDRQSASDLNEQLSGTLSKQKQIIKDQEEIIDTQKSMLEEKDAEIEKLKKLSAQQEEMIDSYKSNKTYELEDEKNDKFKLTPVGLTQYTNLMAERQALLAKIKDYDAMIETKNDSLENLRKYHVDDHSANRETLNRISNLQSEKTEYTQKAAAIEAKIEILKKVGELQE